MKRLLFIICLLMQSHFLFSNEIVIYKSERDLYIYDIKEQNKKKIFSLKANDNNYNIGSIKKNNDSILIIIYYDCWENSNRVIYDKLLSVSYNKCDLIESNKVIMLNNNSFSIETEMPDGIIKKTHAQCFPLDERYTYSAFNKNFYLWGGDGDIFIMRNGKKEMLFERFKNKNLTCGYYAPDISNDENYLVCYYECSKFNRKKHVCGFNILEIDLLTLKVEDLNIKGVNPKYSNDGSFILYKTDDYWEIYNRKIKNVCYKIKANEAYWVK